MNENSNDIGGAAGMNSSADGREAGQFDGGTHEDEPEKSDSRQGHEQHRNPNELDHHDPETEEDTASGGPA